MISYFENVIQAFNSFVVTLVQKSIEHILEVFQSLCNIVLGLLGGSQAHIFSDIDKLVDFEGDVASRFDFNLAAVA